MLPDKLKDLTSVTDVDIQDSIKSKNLYSGFSGRDYEKEPFGSKRLALPEDFYIPSHEWIDRIKDLDAINGQVVDHRKLSGFKSLNQGSTNYCTTEDTEILTNNGWKSWSEYNDSDLLGTMNQQTQRLEFQRPSHIHTFEHKGEMLYSDNKCADFAVTPNHRMYVRKWNEAQRKLNNHFDFVEAKDLGWYFGLPSCTSGYIGTEFTEITIEGDRKYNGNDFIELVSLVVSDGYIGNSEKTKNWISFACTKQGERQDYIRKLANRLGFKEKSTTPGIWIRYSAGALVEWFQNNCYVGNDYNSYNKRIPDFVKCCSEKQIKTFIEIYGDQSHDRKNHFFSTSKLIIDTFQELFLRIGKRCSMYKAPLCKPSMINGKVVTPRRPLWHLHVRSGDKLSIDRKKHLHRENYNGLVYCATVPNSTLITRRNNSMLISGNCWTNGVVHAMYYLRASQGMNHVDLSPASVAAPIKRYRNSGGWASSAVSYIKENGIAEQKYWPANSRSKKYNNQDSKKDRDKYKIIESFDVPSRSYEGLVSSLLRGYPSTVGFNYWSHLGLAVGLTINGKDPEDSLGLIFQNSWGDEWKDNGLGILDRAKSIPDECIAFRTVTPS